MLFSFYVNLQFLNLNVFLIFVFIQQYFCTCKVFKFSRGKIKLQKVEGILISSKKADKKKERKDEQWTEEREGERKRGVNKKG